MGARTEAVESKASQVSMFLVKAEGAIAAKVSTDELERVQRQHAAEVEELSARLLAQMALVHTKVTRITPTLALALALARARALAQTRTRARARTRTRT